MLPRIFHTLNWRFRGGANAIPYKVKNISSHFTLPIHVIFYERDNNKLKIVIVLVLAFLEILNITIEQADEIFSLKNAVGSY